jgi:UDP:flavonoid glycosyltransferase YjiC (YdhE family)
VAASRSRVLFVAEAVTLAHVGRAHALACTLDPARFEVHSAWDPRYNALLGALPYAFHPIGSLSTKEFLRRLSRGAPMHDVETLRAYVKDDLQVIERVRPDLVVGDFRISLPASARVAGVPYIAVANAYWSPYGHQTFLFPEYDYPLSGILGAPAARRLFRTLRRIGFAAHTRPLNVVLREHGLPGIGHDIRVMYTAGDYTAYADIRELAPVDGLPPTHRYIGAVLWSPAVTRPEWWDDLPRDRPIVYVTPGSSGESDFLEVVLDALADLPVVVVAATARRVQVRRPPANARLAEFVPGIEAAARARLVICNGGSPTTYQALAAGVPVLGIVSNNMDQHLNMEAVKRAGAGDVLRARGLTADAARTTVERLLSGPGYAQAARAVAAASRACRASVEMPALIEDVLHAPPSPADTRTDD